MSTDDNGLARRAIETEYGQWRTWIGTDRMFHALRSSGAALTAKGEDWVDLLDQIKRAELMLEDTPRAWRR